MTHTLDNIFRLSGMREAINIAFAGVGRPMKDDICRVSTLNFANRKAEKIGMRNAMYGKSQLISGAIVCVCSHEKRIIPGAIPKLITSDRESSSFPTSEYALSNRAAKPSRKSKMAAR